MRRAYLDHAAGAGLSSVAAQAMFAAHEVVGNPSSVHTSGRRARRLLEEARESVAADLGARPGEVTFTSGGTEANNLALRGARAPGRGVIALSAIEHPSVAAWRKLDDQAVVLPVTGSGHLDESVLDHLLDERAALASVMWVNNETGAVQPVGAVVERARRVGALVHSDAVQAVGHLAVDFGASGLDLLSVTAHKLGGPVGIGALLVRRGVALAPSGFGGGQEAGLRPGTVPVALAAGFAAALAATVAGREQESARLAALRDDLLAGITASIPQVVVNTQQPCGPAIVNVTFSGTRADDVLLLLDREGLDASTGSACTAGVHQPSEVLLAMGATLDEASAALRFSFGTDTTGADVARLLEVLPGAVERARGAV